MPMNNGKILAIQIGNVFSKWGTKMGKSRLLSLPEYVSWSNMKSRCYNQNLPCFRYYGGRGITVCERWRWRGTGFPNFLQDMGKRPQGTSLDRIDNNGNYEPGNCRWADRITQMQNCRKVLKITVGLQTLCMAEWGRRLGGSVSLVRNRIRQQGMDGKSAVLTGGPYSETK